MRKNNIWSIFFTLLFAVTAVYFLIPSYNLYKEDEATRIVKIKEDPKLMKKVINMGLDIQGGMRVVLEMDKEGLSPEKLKEVEADKNLIDKARLKIENRINKYGMSETIVQKKGTERLVVEFPGIHDVDQARQIIKDQAKLDFHLVRSAIGDKEYNAQIARINKVLAGSVADDIKEDTSKTDLDALDELDALDTETKAETDSAKAVEEAKNRNVITLDTYREGLYFRKSERDAVNEILKRADVQNAMKAGTKFLWGHEPVANRDGALKKAANGDDLYELYYVVSEPTMSGDNLKKAQPMQNQQFGGMTVSLEFNAEGASQFAKVTRRNIGRQLAIVLDDIVFSAPNIKEKILGNASISGNFSDEDARKLAIVLEAGKLPVKLKTIQETKVGPSLGKDALEKAAWAAVIGFALVFIFMIYYYKLSGLLAISALFLNVVFILAIMASIGATLTLPGIAGIILIMGMSVDANVIVFERIKEEIAVGKDVRRAIEAGYGRAFVAIMDANVTTLFTALILYGVGSGPIRGFAVTLICGILVSLFTALTFTKMIYNFFTASGKVTKLSI